MQSMEYRLNDDRPRKIITVEELTGTFGRKTKSPQNHGMHCSGGWRASWEPSSLAAVP